MLFRSKAIPGGATARVLGGDAHDRVEQARPKEFVRASRARLAGWIGELLRAEKGLYREIRR